MLWEATQSKLHDTVHKQMWCSTCQLQKVTVVCEPTNGGHGQPLCAVVLCHPSVHFRLNVKCDWRHAQTVQGEQCLSIQVLIKITMTLGEMKMNWNFNIFFLHSKVESWALPGSPAPQFRDRSCQSPYTVSWFWHHCDLEPSNYVLRKVWLCIVGYFPSSLDVIHEIPMGSPLVTAKNVSRHCQVSLRVGGQKSLLANNHCFIPMKAVGMWVLPSDPFCCKEMSSADLLSKQLWPPLQSTLLMYFVCWFLSVSQGKSIFT